MAPKIAPHVWAVDIETKSEVPITDSVYHYVEGEHFDITLISMQRDDWDEPRIWDLTNTTKPVTPPMLRALRKILTSAEITKTAYNANFERVCIAKFFEIHPSELIGQWRCTKAQAAASGLNGSLAEVSYYLDREQKKDPLGKRLINWFCVPDKKTGTFRKPEDHPEKWQQFIDYCLQDVRTERQIARVLPPLVDSEQEVYDADQRILDRGVGIDYQMVHGAVKIMERFTDRGRARLVELTGLDNPGSIQQMKGWLADKLGWEVESLTKDTVTDILQMSGVPTDVREALELRQQLSLASVKKYDAAYRATCADLRIRGLFEYHGASTGRWAGRLLQVQNLPRGGAIVGKGLDDKTSDYADRLMAEYKVARAAIRTGDLDHLERTVGFAPTVLKDCIRTMIVPAPGNSLLVFDYSAIEARVLAWLAGEEDVLNAFRSGQDIYKTTAARMFGLPYADITKDLRQRGKVAVLACGYQGGVGAMERMGGAAMGMTEQQMQDTVDLYRSANPNIVRLWAALDKGMKLVASGKRQGVKIGRLKIRREDAQTIAIILPSGRPLRYRNMHLAKQQTKFGERMSLVYTGKGLNVGFTRIFTYGGMLTENVTQAVARDLLAEALLEMERAGLQTVMHVHDEAVVDSADPLGEFDLMKKCMEKNPEWADGLPLDAEGECLAHYRK